MATCPKVAVLVLAPTTARAQEAVLYPFLENLYDSLLARSGRKKRDRRKSEGSPEVSSEDAVIVNTSSPLGSSRDPGP
jgi:hypothetical protein